MTNPGATDSDRGDRAAAESDAHAPPDGTGLAELARLIDAAFDEMIAHQQHKVLRMGRELAPNVTEEDLRNAQDFGALMADPAFNFEDGILSGFVSARIALKRRILAPLLDGRPPEPALTPDEVRRNLDQGRD